MQDVVFQVILVAQVSSSHQTLLTASTVATFANLKCQVIGSTNASCHMR